MKIWTPSNNGSLHPAEAKLNGIEISRRKRKCHLKIKQKKKNEKKMSEGSPGLYGGKKATMIPNC